nr:Nephrocystin-3 like [Ipomoea batatas]
MAVVVVAASEALVGLHLELGQDDASSVIVNVCLRLLETIKIELGSAGFGALEDHSRALKGLVELVRGDTKSAASFFPEVRDGDCSSNVLDRFIGNAALSYGEFLHRMGDFEMAKQLYTRVIHEESLGKSSSYLHQLSACNMNFEDVILGATCALGQLEAHLG